jgi:hypothetical protein
MAASSGLLNLYRQIEAGEVDLADAPEPEDLPRELGVTFGAQVGWSPSREGGKVDFEWACDIRTRETLIVELCSTCLDGFGDFRLAHRVVCMGCLRYCHDSRIAAILASEAA